MLKKWFSCRDVACIVSTVRQISLHRFVVDSVFCLFDLQMYEKDLFSQSNY